MAAALGYIVVPLILFYVFLTSRFHFLIGPAAAREWADAHEPPVVEWTRGGMVDHFKVGPSNMQLVYRFVVKDPVNGASEGWVIVGHYCRPSLSVETCPIQVRWKGPRGWPRDDNATVRPYSSVWDRDLDG